MSLNIRKRFKILIIIIISGVLLSFSHSYLSSFKNNKFNLENDSYIPEVNYLKFISLGHDGLIADLIFAKALLYYSFFYDKKKISEYRYLKKLFFTAVEMDPMNTDAFLMANNILSDININHSIEILKLGMYYHPKLWKFPEMIGYHYFYYLRNSYMAKKYYEIASKLPGHPLFVPSISRKFFEENGRYRDAIRVLYNFYTTSRDKKLRKSFKDSIEKLKEKITAKKSLLKVEIVKIVDGDSFEFKPDRDNLKYNSLNTIEGLRLIGVNSNEITEEDEKKRLIAFIQKDFAFYALSNRKVTIEFERGPDNSLKRDKYNRLLGYVFLENKKMFQLLALGNGVLKGFYKYPFKREYRKLFKDAEERAKKLRLGLYDFPPKNIELKDVSSNIGKIVTIRFRVYKVFFGKKNIFVDSTVQFRDTFSVVIPLRFCSNFSVANCKRYFQKLRDRLITVTGFLGVYREKPQLRLYFPSQLKTK